MFGELTENLTRHRNELLKKARSLDTVSCAWATDGRIMCLLEDGRNVTVLHERDVDTLSTGRHLAGTNVAIKTTQLDNNYVVWYIIISYIHVILPTAETDTRTEISAGAVHDTKYLSVKHFPLHFCCGGTCNKVSFRQQEFTLSMLLLMLTFVAVALGFHISN